MVPSLYLFGLYPARAGQSPAPTASDLIRLFETLGELFDVLGRPIWNLHTEMETHLRQHFLDLVERLAAEIRGPQHLGLGFLHEIADIDDVVVLQAIRRAHRQLELVDLAQEVLVEGQL